MRRFYKLSITEISGVIEVVVVLRGDLLKDAANDLLERKLNETATEAVAHQFKRVHPNDPEPPYWPTHFTIEPLSTWDPKSVGPGTPLIRSQNGALVWITRPTSVLVYSACSPSRRSYKNGR
jgi:hypothetical protein